jgi:DNA-binding beta-propeller fold protein YncE
MPSASSLLLKLCGYVGLPEHTGRGGFDHAAAHAHSGNVYVAHTANSAVDVFDPEARKHLFSVPQLPGVAGVLVSDEAQLIIATNRAENTVAIFAPGPDPQVAKIAVGLRPNGLAYDHGRRQVLVANVGDCAIPGSHTLSVISVKDHAMRAEISVPGRTRWASYDPDAQSFYVNIADPAQIVVVDARRPDTISHAYSIPSAGPHGLDHDLSTHRLFCACDSGTLVTLDARSGKVLSQKPLSGSPDVVFFDRVRNRLYVAVGDPGVIDVFNTQAMDKLGSITTERGAHTFALPAAGHQLYVFLPASHRAAIYEVVGS